MGGSNGGRDNIRMHWRFNYTYRNSNVLNVAVNCLGSCLEIRIQFCKLESIKVVLFGKIQRSMPAKDFPVILLCDVSSSYDGDSWVGEEKEGRRPRLKVPHFCSLGSSTTECP